MEALSALRRNMDTTCSSYHIHGGLVTLLAIGAEFARLSRVGLVTKAESPLDTESETTKKKQGR